jgi:hypothetical protein
MDARGMLWASEFFFRTDTGHDSTDSPDEFDGDSDFGYTDQSFLDGIDGQCGGDRVQGGAVRGSGLREFCTDCNAGKRWI